MLVLVNGRQVYQDHYGVTYWAGLPVTMPEIRQIEIVRGANTSLFGFNAAAGVVNIITKSPILDDVDVVQVRVGTQNHREVTAVMTENLTENTAARLSVNMADAEGYSGEYLATPMEKDLDGFGRRTVNLNVEHQTKSGGTLRFEANQSRLASDMLLPFNTYSDAQRRTRGVKLEYSKDTAYGLMTVSGYYNAYKAATGRNDLYVAKAENLSKLSENQTLRVAAEFRNNQVKGVLLDDDSTDALKYNVASLSAMHDWALTDKLNWTNSVRFDHLKMWRNENPDNVPVVNIDYDKDDFTRNLDGYSFNTGLMYKADDVNSYRVSVARGLRIPALLQFGVTDVFGGALPFTGNPNLEPEVFMNYEAAYTRQLPSINGSFTATVFHQTIEDVVTDASNVVAGPTFHVYWENAGNTSSTGLELDLKAKPTENFEMGANYSLIRFDDETASTANGSSVSFEPNSARHHANLWGRYTMDQWEFDGALHYVASRDYTASVVNASPLHQEVDDYFMLNTRVGYNINEDTSVSLKGYNLLEEHFEVPSYNNAIGIAGGAKIGRSVYLTLTHKF